MKGPRAYKPRLRELEWQTYSDANETCIYDNGHIAPERFLEAVRTMKISEVPKESRNALKPEDVKHTRFRRYSPTEAKMRGFDWGVEEVQDGETHGFPVTAVIL